MSEHRDESNHGHEKMRDAVRVREERRDQWKREGERSMWRNLSMIGALGWLVVVPTLIGVLIGRWLDGAFDTGIFFTGASIFLGVSVGCYLAWRRVNEEGRE